MGCTYQGGSQHGTIGLPGSQISLTRCVLLGSAPRPSGPARHGNRGDSPARHDSGGALANEEGGRGGGGGGRSGDAMAGEERG